MDGSTGSALRHAPEGADLEAEDATLAAAARARYLKDGLGSIEPDSQTRAALRFEERLLAQRESASIDGLSDGGQPRLSGRLAVTSERLMLVGGPPVTLALLDDVDDALVIVDRLVVMLTTGASFGIEARHPRLLRVELAEARASRAERQGSALPKDASGPAMDPPRR